MANKIKDSERDGWLTKEERKKGGKKKRRQNDAELEALAHDANVEMYGEEDAYYHTFLKD